MSEPTPIENQNENEVKAESSIESQKEEKTETLSEETPETKKDEEKGETKEEGPVVEIATPENMAAHKHHLTLSSVQHASIDWDENLRCRKSMEDGHVVVDQIGGKPQSGYFAIYDGHGGIDAVIYVANNLHKNLEVELEKNPDNLSEALKQSYLVTDQQIGEKEIGSGTTAVSALIAVENGKRMLYTANAGDARAVLSRGGKAKRVSHDHKVSDEGEQKRIQDLGGYIIMHRVNGILAVTRSLGDMIMKELVTGEPYLEINELVEGDTHLILACDGLWDVVEDQEALDLIAAEENKENLSQMLVQTALKRGSTDNISVMVLTL